MTHRVDQRGRTSFADRRHHEAPRLLSPRAQRHATPLLGGEQHQLDRSGQLRPALRVLDLQARTYADRPERRGEWRAAHAGYHPAFQNGRLRVGRPQHLLPINPETASHRVQEHDRVVHDSTFGRLQEWNRHQRIAFAGQSANRSISSSSAGTANRSGRRSASPSYRKFSGKQMRSGPAAARARTPTPQAPH